MTPDTTQSAGTLHVTDSRTGRSYDLPITDGAIRALDLRQIKVSGDDFGLLSYDPAFMNTASCRSAITFIDGEKGILRYRGYPVDELADSVSFLDVAYLLLRGELPGKEESAEWSDEITHHTYVHENVKKFIDGFHHDAHPMGILVSSIAALSTFYPGAKDISNPDDRHLQAVRLIAKIPTLAAFAYRHALGLPYNYPDGELSYTGNLLSMFWKMTEPRYRRTRCSPARWTCCSSCTPTTSRTARPAPCAGSAAHGLTRSPPPPRPPPPCTAPCTAARTSRCCGCCATSARWTASRPTSTA